MLRRSLGARTRNKGEERMWLFGPASRTGLPVLFSGESWRRGWALSRAHKVILPSLRTVGSRVRAQAAITPHKSSRPRPLVIPRQAPSSRSRASSSSPPTALLPSGTFSGPCALVPQSACVGCPPTPAPPAPAGLGGAGPDLVLCQRQGQHPVGRMARRRSAPPIPYNFITLSHLY